MNAQFNLINKSNQSIILFVSLFEKKSVKLKFQTYKYNNEEIFKYQVSIKNSKINLDIVEKNLIKNSFYSNIIGSFIYDISLKYSATKIDLSCHDQIILDDIVLGFCRKDFTYSIYKKDSNKSYFDTKFKISSRNLNLLKSINFLKELVSEPSNIIYPETFTARTKKNINQSKVDIKILKKR